MKPLFQPSSSLKLLLAIGLALIVAGRGAAQVYKGAIVVHAATGEVLFEDRSTVVSPPASVTKLMTFLIIQDAIKAGEITLQTPVEVSASDARMGGTQVWLKHREIFPVEELLYALMIQSANDAAHALSHAAGTTRAQFIARMNDRAKALGMDDTIWRSPHGLPPRSRRLDETDQTSPRDLATLSRTLLAETDVLRYSSIERRPFGAEVRAKPVMMDNHNNLVGRVRGVDGLKTGFTRAAGFCLAATAERDGHRIIAVIMGSPTSKERDIKMAELIEATFAKLPATPPSPMTAPPLPATSTSVQSAPEPAARPILQFTPISLDDAPLVDAPGGDDSNAEPATVRFVLPY